MTPTRGQLFHITHISNLASIALEGLYSDTEVAAGQWSPREIGLLNVKELRQGRPVPLPPGGYVADYVPLYFAARSPMLYMIFRGNVPSYSGGQDEVVYLVTSIETIRQHNLAFVFTDRNAALGYARYGNDLETLHDCIDWDLMEARMWANTDAEPDRKERRMAEFLVQGPVPWSAFIEVAARNDEKCRQAEQVLHNVGVTTSVRPRPEWYF